LSNLVIDTAAVFEPLLGRSRYKGAFGGRGSGKSHVFAENLIEDAVAAPGEMGEGLRAVCIREVQKSLKESAKRLIEAKLEKFGLGTAQGFRVFNDVIETPRGGSIVFQGMQDHTAETVKSLEGFHRAWVEEAQTLSAFSLQLLRPTIRWEDLGRGLASEIWFGWNPRRKTDPVDVFLRGDGRPASATVVRANWSDNPWFPQVLEAERLEDKAKRPDQYGHIWEGEYAAVFTGAYFAGLLAEARAERRIGRVAADPLLSIRAYWDIGGTGAKADATSIWMVQFVGKEIRVLDYYEASGQPLATHVNWLRANGYGGCVCVLPHDGTSNDKVHDASYESALKRAEFEVVVVPNQGKGAAAMRVEAVRRLLPSCWFNEATTTPGLDALGWYHEKRDDHRNVGLGPEHDWSSHAADAFGLVCVAYEDHSAPVRQYQPPVLSGSWMSR
jgi:phage terminase large subunit